MSKKVFDIKPPEKGQAPFWKKPTKEPEEERPGRIVEISWPKVLSKKAVLVILFLIIVGGTAYFTLSKATIEIWPITEPLSFKTKLTVDRTVKQGAILGVLASAEKTVSEEFSSSGKKDLAAKAEGVIRVYNNYSLPQTLVANTRFQAPLEKFQPPLKGDEKPWFRTTRRITVLAKSHQDVKVIADSPGEKYNIQPSKFSIPGLAGTSQYTLVYGESFQEFKGGFQKEVPEVLEEDLEKAKNELLKKAVAASLAELQKEILPESAFLEDSLETEILETSPEAKPGEEVEKFNYQVKVRSSLLTFKKEDLENFAKEYILSKITPGKEIYSESLKTDYSLESSNFQSGTMTLFLNLGARVYSPISETSLKEGLLGKNLTEAKLFLESQPHIKAAKIKLWPFWLKRVPSETEKIEIKLRFD